MRKLNMRELDRIDTDQYKEAPKARISVVLNNIRSLNNVGSVFRTSDAFRVEKIYLGGITAQPPHRDIRKTALGATDSVDWEHHQDLAPLFSELKAAGKILIGVEQVTEKIFLDKFEVADDKEYVLVFGNEVNGIDDDLLPLLDHCIEIPQWGTKHSFNISVSVGIVLWDLTQKGLGVS